MKKRIVAALLLCTMALSACGQGDAGGRNTSGRVEKTLPYRASGNSQNLTKGIKSIKAPDAEISDAQKEALSKASFQLFANTLQQEDARTNVLLSPTSIALAFGMTENGACGETLAQMEQVIGGGIGVNEMNPLLYQLSQRLESSKDVYWNVANSIWFKDDGKWQVKDDFAAKALSWYGADIWKAAFDDTTLADINGWVSNETKGMIPSILDGIPDDARMYLINAIAFEGEWENEYEESDILEKREFTNADGSKKEVTMLFSNENRYFTLGDGTGFLRDYKGGEYSFMGLLPEEGTDLNAYVTALSDEDADIAEAIRNCTYGSVVVQIPEFEDDYDIEMSNVLKSMGMELAFEEGAADFTEMMEPTSDDPYEIWINRVLHKTHIEVNREGTRAAAATAIEMDAVCTGFEPSVDPVIITLDRPFIYGIIDNETGLPIFLGCVNTL